MSSYEEIRPRELKPALLELDGISRASVEAHYKLYEGYVNKRNEILGKLGSADRSEANQVYSEVRALKVELSFAVGGIKNHEVYFEHLGGHGGDPDGPIGTLVRRDFGSNPAEAPFTTTSSPPSSDAARSTRARASSARARSPSRLPAASTRQPSACSRSTSPRPSLPVPPVTSARVVRPGKPPRSAAPPRPS